MTAAAQAARIRTGDPVLAAYLLSRPDGYPEPAPDQSINQFLDTSFERGDVAEGFCTGYFEPDLRGALQRSDVFATPIYQKPPDLIADQPYYDRRSIEDGALDGQGLEIAWLADPIEAFFLHIQGSGRVRLDDGRILRVGFSGKNGHPYKSIGKVLVERGIFSLEQVTAQAIKDWLAAHPEDAARVMNENPSYIFFAKRPHLTEAEGPIGTAGVPLTPMISVAADPDHHLIGALIHIQHDPATGLNDGYAIVQDTGGAIKGQGRIDLFTGSGDAAGQIASGLKHPVRISTFAPKKAPT